MTYIPIVGAALFAVLYGALRPAYDLLYRPLGLSVDDLGISETRIVGHAAGYAASLLLTLGATALLGYIAYRSTRLGFHILDHWKWLDSKIARYSMWTVRKSQQHGTWWLLSWFVSVIVVALVSGVTAAVLVAAIVDAAAEQSGIVPQGNARGALVLVLVAILLGAAWATVVELQLWKASDETWRNRLTRFGMAVFGATTILVIATRATDFWTDSQQLGERLISGEDLGEEVAVLSWLDVTLSPSRVHPLTQGDPLGLCDGESRPYLLGYNGSSAYVLIFPDRGEDDHGRVARLTSSLYAISSGLDESAPCDLG